MVRVTCGGKRRIPSFSSQRWSIAGSRSQEARIDMRILMRENSVEDSIASHFTWGCSLLSFSWSAFRIRSSSEADKAVMEDFLVKRGGNFFLKDPPPFRSTEEPYSANCSGGTSGSGFGFPKEETFSWKSEIIFFTLKRRTVA